MGKILVIRNDKLGDFMLAWPAFSLIKQQYPEATIAALVPSYTKPMAEICPWIDEIIIDVNTGSVFKDAVTLSRLFKKAGINKSISLYSQTRTSLALRLAGICERFGPATKLAQLFLNKKLRQNRSLSHKPEYEYNTDLVRYFIQYHGDEVTSLPEPPYLSFDSNALITKKSNYYSHHSIDTCSKLVIIHPGTGGSAINLTIQQFAELAKGLSMEGNLHFIITAGPQELENARALSTLIPNLSHTIYHSAQGLVSFSRFIAISDLFISGSTGPLHIAGALNIPTVAFYSARRSATALRWQTLNQGNRRLAFMPGKYTKKSTTLNFDINQCISRICEFLQQID